MLRPTIKKSLLFPAGSRILRRPVLINDRRIILVSFSACPVLRCGYGASSNRQTGGRDRVSGIHGIPFSALPDTGDTGGPRCYPSCDNPYGPRRKHDACPCHDALLPAALRGPGSAPAR